MLNYPFLGNLARRGRLIPISIPRYRGESPRIRGTNPRFGGANPRFGGARAESLAFSV
jgi:hypothetical protein